MSTQGRETVTGADRASRTAVFAATKFLPPPLVPGYVTRPRLDAELDRSATVSTTVVCGPAGAGKTLLVSAFTGRRDEPCSWITLDERDGEPAVFWADVSHAFDRLFSGARGTEPTVTDDDPARRFTRSAVELAAEAADPSFLVIDAVQVLSADRAAELIPRVAEALPRSVHLVLVSRRLPPLSLHRLRAQADLVEISGDDLRFSFAEAVTLFGDSASRAQVAAHVEATQGWATGLALAGGPAATPGETERAVRDYLSEEVVASQPADVQRFLTEIACLRQLNAAVCERVTGRTDAGRLLRQLAHDHAFVTANADEWGRYDMHPQLRSMLCDELRAVDPHRAAAILADGARWYEEQDNMGAAIDQWLDAGRDHDALQCLRRAIELFGHADPTQLRQWTARIDPVAAAGQPALLLDLAVASALSGDDVRARDATERADNRLRTSPDPESEFRATLMHARLALGAGDIESAVVALQAARDLFASEPARAGSSLERLPLARQVHAWLALGQSWLGYRAEARATLDSRPTLPNEGAADRVLAWGVEAAIAFNDGFLNEAFAHATRARDAAAAANLSGWCGWPAAQVLAGLMRESAGADAALRAFELLVKDTKEPAGNVLSIAAHVGLSTMLRMRGDANGALERLSRTARDLPTSPRTVAQGWIDQGIVMTYLRMGHVRAAREALGPPPYRDDDVLVAALIALAEHRGDEARRLAATVRRDTPRPELLATLVDARASVLLHDVAGALNHVRHAMQVAQQHGFMRTVLDYGTALLPEFTSEAVTAADAEFVSRLRDEVALAAVPTDRSSTDARGLSGRELDVLRYLATHLSTREIAQALHVSRNTVKSHMQHLYRKLGVGTRAAAVERGRRLQLLR
jgi:LuxR family maltose regulon positive regulatory protein